MNVAKKLLLLRRAARCSQKQLADRVGMPPSQLNRYEHGLVRPKLRNLERLALALKVPVSELVR